MAPLPELSFSEWSMVYNSLSFGIAAMGAASVFFFIQVQNVGKSYKTALTITGLVTFIAFYHYVRIFDSWVEAYSVTAGENGEYSTKLSGAAFNDAYRYVDWLLTVPLLLIELVLVMKLPAEETAGLATRLGAAAALMVCLGYPGEISEDQSVRWFWWSLSMLPFVYVVGSLVIGLADATAKQPNAKVVQLVTYARYLTVVSWCTYPAVYAVKSVGLSGATATVYEQVGYSIADVVAKAVFGVLVWAIAAEKTHLEEAGQLLK